MIDAQFLVLRSVYPKPREMFASILPRNQRLILTQECGRYAQSGVTHAKLRGCRRRASTLQTPSNNEQIIFSGIQPTGVPHLGNYLGAVREWVRLQNDSASGSKLFLSIVDLHALTVPQDAHRLKEQRREMFAMLLAAGLDPKQSTIFYQSTVCDAILCLFASV